MKKLERKLRANSSGQLLIVAALAIAIIISSTTIYVYELGNETSTISNYSTSDFILALKQCIRNAVISSLANASVSGEKTVLKTNLGILSQTLQSLHQSQTYYLSSITLNNSNYESGVWLSWNTNDFGVSSAFANSTLKVYGMTGNITADWFFNITTAVVINGFYTELQGSDKFVNLTCHVLNEGRPALAKNISVFYEDLGIWIPVDSSSLSVVDDGNGTYSIFFTVNTSSEAVPVSIHIYDLRSIYVQANTTCSQA